VTSVGTNRNLNALLAEHAQVGFAPDDVSNIIKESIDSVLQNQQYSEQKVSLRCPASASSKAARRFAALYSQS
jgi:catalase